MKRIISSLLCVILLVSCAPAVVEKPTSSADGVAKYTAFLEERLEKMPDELTVARAEDASAYGVDMSAFADDGYLIRAEAGEVLILGKTDKGLDRAVREYVKNGNDQDFFKVYNEGYRVKRLTIAGNDISEYAILRDDTADECHSFASSELKAYIEKTCGTILPEYTVSEYAAASDKPSRTILITVDYPTLGDEAFCIEIGDDSNVTISGGRYRGCMYGVYGLLYNMGWRSTGYGVYGGYFSVVTDTIEYLYESDHVDLTADINRTEDGAIPDRITRTGNLKLFDNYSINNNYSRGGYGILDAMSHGMQSYHNEIFSGEYEGLFTGDWNQPCYSDKNIYYAVRDWAFRRMAALRETFTVEECPAIDISHWDMPPTQFCGCKDCGRILKEERSHAGPILRMANSIAEELNVDYPGAKVHILAYYGTEQCPKITKPSEHIVVGFCFYIGSCQNHCISGEDCETNAIFAEWFKGWVDTVAPGNLIAWYYPFAAYSTGFHAPFYTSIRDDIKFLAESGIELLYVCANFCNSGVTNDQLAAYLCAKFSWDYDYTDEEMYALIEEWLTIIYGDSGYYIYEYLMLCERASDMTGCWLAFDCCSDERVNNEFMIEHFDYMYGQFEKAKAVADTEVIEELVERCKAGMLYLCVGLTYESKYTNGTPEERALTASRYKEAYDLFKRYSIPPVDCINSEYYVPDEFEVDRSPFDAWSVLDNYW